MSIEANQIMNYLLGCFENHQTPAGGWYLESQLRQLPWNKHFNSLHYLDHFFEIYHNTNPEIPNPNNKDIRNTILLLAAYIGQTIAYATDHPHMWYSHQKFVESNPEAHQHIAKSLSTSMLLRVGEQWVSPIDLVYKQFFSPQNTIALSIQIENLILSQQLRYIHNPTAWMHIFQQMVQQQAFIPGGLAYADIIEKNKSQWDYSIASLQQLDGVLYQIQLNQDFNENQKQLRPDQINFIFWVGAYLGSTIAKLAHCPIYWHNQENISQVSNQPVSDAISHFRVAQLGSEWYFILGFVMDYLLGKTDQDIPQYAYSIIKTLSNHTQVGLETQALAPKTTDIISKKAMLASGYTAAHMLSKLAKQKKMFVESILFDGQYTRHDSIDDEAVEFYWQRNPHKQSLLSLAYSSTIHLPTMLTPCVEVKTKIQMGQQDTVNITIAFPFLPSTHYRGFTILQPHLLNAPKPLRQSLEEAAPYLLLGIQQFETKHAPFWAQYASNTLLNT